MNRIFLATIMFFSLGVQAQSVWTANAKQTANAIVERITNKKRLSDFVGGEMLFVYHRWDRCEGSMAGYRVLKPGSLIDQSFDITVARTGLGWADCDRELGIEQATFNLNDQLKYVDSLNMEVDETTLSFMLSDDVIIIRVYLKKEGESYLIDKFGFSSTDPG